ncbi:MAG: hypothetical protein IPP51_12305 [Bacteroidetes bacterium]|nr:hypothetical protein [Bacteroidota bacterium]
MPNYLRAFWGEGLYLNSDTYKSKFILFTSYRSASGVYSLFANARWQSIEDQMNGGIQNDSAFLFT